MLILCFYLRFLQRTGTWYMWVYTAVVLCDALILFMLIFSNHTGKMLYMKRHSIHKVVAHTECSVTGVVFLYESGQGPRGPDVSD